MTRKEINEEIHKEVEEEQSKEKRKKIIKILIKLIVLTLVITTSFFWYTTYISTVKVNVREYRINDKKIPNSFNGAKIIQISDLHFGSTFSNKELDNVINLINERKPDLVFFTGDLIAKEYNLTNKQQEKLINQLKKINSSLGKYAIIGDEDLENVNTIYNQSDFTVLKNESEFIYKDKNEPILLVGISSSKKEQNIDQAYKYFTEETHNSNIYTISLLHEADIVDKILESYKTDLFLAGHSHNGTIRIPIINYPLIQKEGSKKYHQEYYQVKDSKLYISSGLGSENGIRLFCRPSINFFRLSNK
jgi:predicted MPP superfamily phosphohydrolase